jgi:YHS domain-containing protein
MDTNGYPRYVFVPNRFLGNLNESFVELPSSYDMFDELGIHHLVTKVSRRFSVLVDARRSQETTLACLKSSWEMTGHRTNRCFLHTYLLNTFQQALNVTYYYAQPHQLQKFVDSRIGVVIVAKLFGQLHGLQSNLLSQLGDVTMEALYCQKSTNSLRKYTIFISAFDIYVWGLLLLSTAVGAVSLCLESASNVQKTYLNLFYNFLSSCFEIFRVVLEQGVKQRKLTFVGFSLTTAFLLNVYKSQIFSGIVLNPNPSDILSISHLLRHGFVIHMLNKWEDFHQTAFVYNSTKRKISRNLEGDIQKKFQKNPEQYLDVSNGPGGIEDLKIVFSTSPKYALVLIGPTPYQNAYLNNLKLAFAPHKFCSRTKFPLLRTRHFAKFLNPLFLSFKMLSQSLHESGFMSCWNNLENHVYSLLIQHSRPYGEPSTSDSNLNKDELLNLKHLYPVMLICLCCFLFSSLILVLEILGHSYCNWMNACVLINHVYLGFVKSCNFCIVGLQRLVGNFINTVKNYFSF